jgi:hypothetical protein
VAVDGSGPANVTSVTVRSSDGRQLTLEVGRLDLANGLPAAHLREHLVSGLPIFVTCHVDNGVNIATRYVDALVPASPP